MLNEDLVLLIERLNNNYMGLARKAKEDEDIQCVNTLLEDRAALVALIEAGMVAYDVQQVLIPLFQLQPIRLTATTPIGN